MKICFYNFNLGPGNPTLQSLFGGMYRSFWNAFERRNIEIFATDDYNRLEGDILVVFLGGNQERGASLAMKNFPGPVAVTVPPASCWFYKSFLLRWRHKIIFAFGTDSSRFSAGKYASIKIPYYHLAFASDPEIFKPVPLPKLYDIVFVATFNSGEGRYEYIEKLVKTALQKKWNLQLVGKGWDKLGYPFQIIAHGPLLNYVYQSAKICINLHNTIQYSGNDIQMDANNRLFDLAMAGCFQVNNGEQLVRVYYSDDEVPAADDADNWIELVDYYLAHESERMAMAEKARSRSLKEHTWDYRVDQFIRMIQNHKEGYSGIPSRFYHSLLHLYDFYFMPVYLFKHIRVIRRIREWFGYRIRR